MKRKKYSNELKTKVALAAIKAQGTANEIASDFRVHSSLVNRWKKQALEGLPEIFGDNKRAPLAAMEKEKDRLYQQIGKLQVELDWLKKKSGHLA